MIQKSKDLPKFLRHSRYGLWRRWHRHFALSASNGQGTLNPWTSCTSSALWCFGYPFRRGKAVNDLNECELVVNSLRLRVSHKVDSYVESHESTNLHVFGLSCCAEHNFFILHKTPYTQTSGWYNVLYIYIYICSLRKASSTSTTWKTGFVSRLEDMFQQMQSWEPWDECIMYNITLAYKKLNEVNRYHETMFARL